VKTASNYLSRGRVIVIFVPKFVAMATGVGRSEILTTSLDSPKPKIGGTCKECAITFHRGRGIVNFVPKFVAMATGVSKGEI